MKHELESFYEDTLRCMRCGLCRGLCPLWGFVGWESGSPRGRMQIVKALIEGNLEPNEYVMDRLYKCALCGYCLWRCPPGVRTTDVIKAARAHLVHLGIYPKEIDTIEENLKEQHNIYGLPAESRTEWVELMDISDIPIGEKADIVYFPGCLSSYSGRAMNIAYSTALILNSLGLNWTLMGEEEWCCGNPLQLSGKIDLMEEIVNHNVEVIHSLEAKVLVTSCAGCYRTFIQDYPHYAKKLGFEVRHISQVISENLDKIKLNYSDKPQIVTYHDPCELGRHVGLYDAPRNILKAIPTLQFVELPAKRELTKCCGGGGVLKMTNPELAIKLASEKVEEAYSVNAEILSTCCPACVLNITEGASTSRKDIKILDVVEIVAQAMGLTE